MKRKRKNKGMKELHYLLFLILLVCLSAVSQCSDSEDENGIPNDKAHADYHNANTNKEGAFYVMTETGVNSSKFASLTEMPKLQQGDILIVHQATDMKGRPVNYSVAYMPALHHSRWVAFRFDNTMKARSVSRKDHSIKPQYPKDPLCDATTKSDASFNGYDHGHLCASADRLCSRVANDQTFYMSNMSPQLASFNQDYWTKYESFVQNLGRNCGTVSGSNTAFADTLFVVKGGTVLSAKETTKVEDYRMPVPDHYFMALLSVKNGKYAAIGFWMDHRKYDLSQIKNDKTEIAAHAVSIDRLEALTGIDFFCNLPGAVEKAVEASCIPTAWGL